MIIPRYGSNIVLNGHQSKILVTDFAIGSKKLLYSTIEVLTYAVIDSVETLVLWAPTGESGEFSVKGATSASVLSGSGSGSANINFYKGSDEVTASFPQKGSMSVIMFSNGLRVVVVDRITAYRFWAPTLTANPFAPANQTGKCQIFAANNKDFTDYMTVLVQGPYLVRSVSLSSDGKMIQLTGDIDSTTTISAWGPKLVSVISWNGVNLPTTRTASGSLTATVAAPNSGLVKLPTLTSWKARDSLPERLENYNDSGVAWVGK